MKEIVISDKDGNILEEFIVTEAMLKEIRELIKTKKEAEEK